MTWTYTIIGAMGDQNPEEGGVGTIYLKSTSETNGTVWVRRDWSAGFDLRITDYGKGQFSIARVRTDLYTLNEYMNLGHHPCDEDEFNNMLIEVSNWLLYNSAKQPRKRRAIKNQEQSKV
jgi:hypothetical protein